MLMGGLQELDPYQHEPIDAEAMIRALLESDVPSTDYPNAVVRSSILNDANLLSDRPCVVHDVGAPRDLGYGMWKIPLSIYVLSSDPDVGNRFSRYLYRRVMAWPWNTAGDVYGHVGTVTPIGFSRHGPDDMNLAYDVHVWEMTDFSVTARNLQA